MGGNLTDLLHADMFVPEINRDDVCGKIPGIDESIKLKHGWTLFTKM